MAQNTALSGPITFVLSERCVLFSSQLCDNAHHLHSAWRERLSEIVDRPHGQNDLVVLRMRLRLKREAVEIAAEAERRRLRETERRFIERRDTIRRKFRELRFF